MNVDPLLLINFWEAKQLEYWLKDNYPDCKISVLNNELNVGPETKEFYRIEGNVDTDLACMLKLKYGDFGNLDHGKI